MNTTPEDELQRRRRELFQASVPVAGHGKSHPAAELERVAAVVREEPIRPDVYGTGPYLEAFEAEVAELLGMPAARFMPSGCMAQPIALRIWADRADNRHTAFHATSHLELHEAHGYRELHGLEAHLLGDPHRPTVGADLDGLPALSSLLVELPAREIGGQLPTWEALVALSVRARDQGTRMHLDGARLWQAQVAYGRPFAEICALFDSVYVSFYKGIGALPGAMLLGPTDFVEEAATWQRRQGGTLYTALANVVSARTRLGPQLAKMGAYRERALRIAAAWAACPGVRVNPDPPQASMFHVWLPGEKDALLAARDAVAEDHGVWLFGGLREDDGGCRFEVSMGDASLAIEDETLARALEALGALRSDGPRREPR